jgi:hypothetical protein
MSKYFGGNVHECEYANKVVLLKVKVEQLQNLLLTSSTNTWQQGDTSVLVGEQYHLVLSHFH